MKNFIIGLTLLSSFVAFGANQNDLSSCEKDLAYAYTFSSLAYVNKMTGKEFIASFIKNEQVDSREELLRDVRLKPVYERAKSFESEQVPVNVSLLSFAMYLHTQGVLRGTKSQNLLINISAKHFTDDNSTFKDLVDELVADNVFYFSACN